MKKFRLVVCVLSALLLTNGCHPISVKTGYDRGANFASRRMYAWQAASKLDTGDPRFDTRQMERAIRDAVDATLAAKGFQKSDSENPGFLVGYVAGIGSETSTVTRQRTLEDSIGEWGWTGSHTVDFRTGALVLEMTDPTTQRMLWRSEASAVVVPVPSSKGQEATSPRFTVTVAV